VEVVALIRRVNIKFYVKLGKNASDSFAKLSEAREVRAMKS
jgi:hypothetical protein